MGERAGPNAETIADIHEALFEDGHRTVLVFGPPGSGKTYVAAQLAAEGATRMREGQRALVLTFSVNAADQITQEVRKAVRAFSVPAGKVEVLNYHALYKRLLDAYGRYCGLRRQWRTWMLHEVKEALRDLTEGTLEAKGRANEQKVPWELSNAVWLAEGLTHPGAEAEYPEEVRARAADILRGHHRDGRVHYDSWAYYAYRLLADSPTLRRHFGNRYPMVIVDEFQDTNGVEWAFINELARERQLVCMADPAQEIYQWKGADATARLKGLRDERRPEMPEGFALSDRVRHSDNPDLAAFADAVRGLDCETANKVAIPTGVDFKGIVPVSGDAGWRGPCRTYAAEVRREVVRRHGGTRDRRTGVLCPTWDLLAGVSHALLGKWGARGPLPHAVAGTDEQVGAFLGALTHALSARLHGGAQAAACTESEIALNELTCVAQGVGPNAVWFGPHRTGLRAGGRGPKLAAPERRRDEVCGCLAQYVSAPSGGVREAVEGVRGLADAVREAMRRDLQVPTWIVDPFLNRPVETWHGRVTEYLRRRPDAAGEEVVRVAWGAVEECVARERRVLGRRHLVLMTADSAKGREFHTTIVCGASRGSWRLDAGRKGRDCEGVRNLWHVACSRSRERVVILYEEGKPACLLAVLQGEPCPRQEEEPRRPGKRRRRQAKPQQLGLFEPSA